jgi:hypothetical protein
MLAPSGSTLITSISARASEESTGAYLRLSMLTASENANSSPDALYPCPGCKHIAIGRAANNLAGNNSGSTMRNINDWMRHVIGCVAIPGGAVTKRHNSIRDFLHRRACDAGYELVVLEPRNLRLYTCGCGLNLEHDDYVKHRRGGCPKAVENPRSHGPDLLYKGFDGNTIAIDVRVCNELSDTNRGKPLANIFQAAAEEKERHYGALCRKSGITLLTFAVSALGALSETSESVLKRLASDTSTDVKQLKTRVSCLAAVGSAYALATAEGHAGIRPTPRVISQATLHAVREEYGIPLAVLSGAFTEQLRKQNDECPRLGVPAPTVAELSRHVQQIADFASRLEDMFMNVLSRAETAKQEETDAERRELAASNPLHSFIPQQVVQRDPSAAAKKSTKSPSVALPADNRQRRGASAYRDSQMYRIANEQRELDNTAAEARASVLKQREQLSLTRQSISSHAAQVDELAKITNAQAAESKAVAEAITRAHEDLTTRRESLAATMKDSADALVDQLGELDQADKEQNEAAQRLSRARSESAASHHHSLSIVALGRDRSRESSVSVANAALNLKQAQHQVSVLSQAYAPKTFDTSYAREFSPSVEQSAHCIEIHDADQRQREHDLQCQRHQDLQRQRQHDLQQNGAVLGQVDFEPPDPWTPVGGHTALRQPSVNHNIQHTSYAPDRQQRSAPQFTNQNCSRRSSYSASHSLPPDAPRPSLPPDVARRLASASQAAPQQQCYTASSQRAASSASYPSRPSASSQRCSSPEVAPPAAHTSSNNSRRTSSRAPSSQRSVEPPINDYDNSPPPGSPSPLSPTSPAPRQQQRRSVAPTSTSREAILNILTNMDDDEHDQSLINSPRRREQAIAPERDSPELRPPPRGSRIAPSSSR